MEIKVVLFHCVSLQIFLQLSKIKSRNFLVSEASWKCDEKVPVVARGFFFFFFFFFLWLDYLEIERKTTESND